MFKKIYWLKNFETNENLTIPEDKISIEELKRYNENWFNIYQSVNTFIWNKRQDKDLAEIKSCFVDIDFPEIVELKLEKVERNEYMRKKYKDIKTILNEIYNLFKIKPSCINVTHKGFHILFDYEDSCYFIEPNIHKEINNKLNEMLWGDENARDLSRVYKIPWFVDWKGWNKWKIKTLEETDYKITKDIIENNFLISFKERDSNKLSILQDKNEDKKEKFNSNIEKINSFDSLEFINNLKDYFWKFLLLNKFEIYSQESINEILNKLKYKEISSSCYSFLEKDGIQETSGLRLELNSDWIWKINDYSKKNRRGNYNFLKNWILENIKNTENKLNSIIHKSLNLTTNSSNKVVMDYQLMKSLFYDELDFEFSTDSNFNIDSKKLSEEDKIFIEKTKERNSMILRQFKQNYFKVFIGLFVFLRKNIENETLKTTQDGYYEIEWNEFLSKMYNLNGKEETKHLKPVIKEYLSGLSDLKIPIISKTITNSGKTVETIERKSFIEIKFQIWWKSRWDKSFFFVKPSLMEKFIFSSTLWIKNMKILNHQKWFKNLQPTYFHDKIYTVLNNFKTNIYIDNFENCFKILELTSSDEKQKLKTLRHHLKEWVENWYYADFEIDKAKKQIKVFRYSKEK